VRHLESWGWCLKLGMYSRKNPEWKFFCFKSFKKDIFAIVLPLKISLNDDFVEKLEKIGKI
jgi:hypothetical protein